MSNIDDVQSTSSASVSGVSTELFSRLHDEEKLLERVVLNFLDRLKRRDQTPSDMSECITIPVMMKQRRKCGPPRVVDGRLWRWSDMNNHMVICQRLQAKSTDNCCAARHNEVCLNPHHYVTIDAPVAQEVPDSSPPWATIAYYELDQKVGETFHCSTESIYVDGYNYPDMPKTPQRFGLWELPNSDRSFDVENYRKQIGGGFRLYYVWNRIYLRCMSDSAMFVQSAFYSTLQKRHKDTVWMMTSSRGYIIQLFDDDVYADWLLHAVGKGEEVVHKLAKMCTVRISFGKGWGSWDEDEPLITSSPCWLEVRLKRQLRKVDKVLQQMGAPYRLHH